MVSGLFDQLTQNTRGSTLLIRAGLCLAVIICGLALRGFGLGLGVPSLIVKYGGSILWGTMVFLLVATLAPRLAQRNIALIATAIAIAVELFRLVHTPGLDAFRLTTAGALLLGRVFSLWNMLAYVAGIALGVLLDKVAFAKAGVSGGRSHSES